MDYAQEDKAAMERALLSWRMCPTCRADLRPVAALDSVWACYGDSVPLFKHSPETWYIPEAAVSRPQESA